MRKEHWDQAQAIDKIRDRVWLYLTGAATPEEATLLAGALFQLRWEQRLLLAETHFLLSREVEAMLQRRPWLMRRLATASIDEEERSTDRVRGRINWPRTIGERASSGGNPSVYITNPPRRAYQTPENEVLVHVLDAIERIAVRLGHTIPGTGAAPTAIARQVEARGLEATSWGRMPQLAEIERSPLSPRTVARAGIGRKRRIYNEVFATYDRLHALVERQSWNELRSMVEHTLLRPATDSVLFELRVLFDVMELLQRSNWEIGAPKLIMGSTALECRKGEATLAVWYQHTPPELSSSSIRAQVLREHDIGQAVFRPDLVFFLRDGAGLETRLLVECKCYEDPAKGARAAVDDLLAYRRAFDTAIPDHQDWYGLGVVWGAELSPAQGEIRLCTIDRLEEALLPFFGGGNG